MVPAPCICLSLMEDGWEHNYSVLSPVPSGMKPGEPSTAFLVRWRQACACVFVCSASKPQRGLGTLTCQNKEGEDIWDWLNYKDHSEKGNRCNKLQCSTSQSMLPVLLEVHMQDQGSSTAVCRSGPAGFIASPLLFQSRKDFRMQGCELDIRKLKIYF